MAAPEPYERIRSRIESATDRNKSPFVKLFLYGEPGTWKTTTACRIWPGYGRVLHYVMNNDDTSLDRFPDVLDLVDVYPYDGVKSLDHIADMKLLGQLDEYTTFVLDTVDGWVNAFIYELVTKVKYSNPQGTGNSRTIIQPKSGANGALQFINEMELSTTEQADYNMARIHLQPIINKLCRGKWNVIINCHAKKVDGKTEKVEAWAHVRPNLPEQTYLNTAGEVDAMGYMKKNFTTGKVDVTFFGRSLVSTKSRIKEIEDKEFPVDEFVKIINQKISQNKENGED